jgi:glycosyltransferase involved in cell wall biosynthesis
MSGNGGGGSKKISAIVACYRDAQAIPTMAERLAKCFQKIGVDYEIIFVNDGSPDDTQSVLERLAARTAGSRALPTAATSDRRTRSPAG